MSSVWKPSIKSAADCPCGSALSYGECCGPFHTGQAAAPTPVALMRSRYSAYVLKHGQYLLSTWHGSTAPGDMEWDSGLKWIGLEVLHAESNAEAGVVEFRARYKQNGRAGQLHEVSRFVLGAGAWVYVDGQTD